MLGTTRQPSGTRFWTAPQELTTATPSFMIVNADTSFETAAHTALTTADSLQFPSANGGMRLSRAIEGTHPSLLGLASMLTDQWEQGRLLGRWQVK